MFIYLYLFFIFVLTLLTRIIKTYGGVFNEKYGYTNGSMSVRQSRKIDMLLFYDGVAYLIYLNIAIFRFVLRWHYLHTSLGNSLNEVLSRVTHNYPPHPSSLQIGFERHGIVWRFHLPSPNMGY